MSIIPPGPSPIAFDPDILREALRRAATRDDVPLPPRPVIRQLPPRPTTRQFSSKNYIPPLRAFIGNVEHAKGMGYVKKRDLQKAFANSQSLADLEAIFKWENTSTELSYLGGRYIYVLGYEGTLPLDALADRVMKILKKNPEFDLIERDHGARMAPIITHLYRYNDSKLEQCCFLVRLLAYLRDCLPSFDDIDSYTRALWMDTANETESHFHWRDYGGDQTRYREIFDYYTSRQYQDAFQRQAPNHADHWYRSTHLSIKRHWDENRSRWRAPYDPLVGMGRYAWI